MHFFRPDTRAIHHHKLHLQLAALILTLLTFILAIARVATGSIRGRLDIWLIVVVCLPEILHTPPTARGR